MTTGNDSRRVRDAVEKWFGHSSFRPGQEATIRSVLEGRDVLLVAPTGAGKSLTYQVAGLLLDGCTVVVSPLLALQLDQIRSLDESGLDARAVRISSAETDAQRDEALDRAEAGEVDFLFLSPEQLADDDVRSRLARVAPTLVAVDEAHCVSAWGHDFRPDYFRVGDLVAEVGSPRVIAMTATAAPPVRADIVDRLRMNDHRLVVTGFRRDNLALNVVRAESAEAAQRTVLDTVEAAKGPGIVYCRTRRATEETAEAVEGLGRSTAVYHAGLSKRDRDRAHETFMSGDTEVIVATSAFGMGIDKPDIRFVVHAQVPESPDTYYQEVGRGGRDGEPAAATLVYRPEDLSLGRFFSGGIPRRDDVLAVLAAAGAEGVDSSGRRAVQERSGLGARKVGRILNLAEQLRDSDGFGDDPAAAVIGRAEAHKDLLRSRVEMMRAYAESTRCRSEYLLGYFGEEERPLCGICDNCLAGVADEPVTGDAPYPPQTRVRHDEFGEGVLQRYDGDALVSA